MKHSQRRTRSSAVPIAGLAALLFIVQVSQTGCEMIYEEMIKDPVEGASRPPESLGSPAEETGVLLVHADMLGGSLFGFSSEYDIKEVRIGAVVGEPRVLRARPFAHGLAVFSGLAPGEYKLWSVHGFSPEQGDPRNKSSLVKAGPAGGSALTAAVEAGRVSYLGKFTFYPGQEREPDVELDPEFEREALLELKKRYRYSTWTLEIDRRLSELGGG